MTQPNNPAFPDPIAAPLGEETVVARTVVLLNELLAQSHPKVAAGLRLAAVPHSYDRSLLTVLRDEPDGHDAKMLARLGTMPFVESLGDGARYRVSDIERDILLRTFIEDNPDEFVDANRRARDFWQARPAPNTPFERDQIVYHALLADARQPRAEGLASISYLTEIFRQYANGRHLAAAERLLESAAAARPYLGALGCSWRGDFDDLLAYLYAVLAQMRGDWDDSHGLLSDLDDRARRGDLSPALHPYVLRALGRSLAHGRPDAEGRTIRRFVAAINAFKASLAGFTSQAGAASGPAVAAELAAGHIALGDAYVGLALVTRGYESEPRTPSAGGFWTTLANLPLVLYLWRPLGSRVWTRRFAPVLRRLDWIVARLFATGAHHYGRALDRLAPLRSTHPADYLVAAQRQADLFLTMGDYDEAARRLRALLGGDPAPGEYQRAVMQVGLAEALLRLGDVGGAADAIAAAMPIAHDYEDLRLQARAHTILAQIYFDAGVAERAHAEVDAALAHYDELYEEQGDLSGLVGATETAESLHVLAADPALDDDERARALATAERLARRHYYVPFRHGWLVFFSRAAAVLLLLVLFLIPLLIIRVDTQIIYPESGFLAGPDVFIPDVAAGVAARLAPRPLLRWGAYLAGAYLALFTVVGWLIIRYTPLRTLQAAQARALRFDAESARLGSDPPLRWGGVREVYTANVHIGGAPAPDESSLQLVGEEDRTLTISGGIPWYASLGGYVMGRLPEGVRRRDLSYRWFRSRLGALFFLTLLLLAAFAVLSIWRPELLQRRLPGAPYRLIDLYPYLYLGLLVPALAWLVVRPLAVRAALRRRSRYAWLVFAVGLVVAAGAVWRAWFPLPDIFPRLTAVILLLSAAAFIWRARDGWSGRRRHAWPVRLGVLAVAIVVGGLLAWQLFNEMLAFELLVRGSDLRDRALALQESEPARSAVLYAAAIDNFERARTLRPNYLPAHYNLADASLQLATVEQRLGGLPRLNAAYQLAIDNYRAAPGAAQTVDNLAGQTAVHLAWGSALMTEGDPAGAAARYELALADVAAARALGATDLRFTFWAGQSHQALGDFEAARREYDAVLAVDPDHPGALLGKGLLDFQDATQRCPQAQAGNDAAALADINASCDEARAILRQSVATGEMAGEEMNDESVVAVVPLNTAWTAVEIELASGAMVDDCACAEPTATPTPTPTISPTTTSTRPPTTTPTYTPSPTLTPTATPSPTPSPTPTATPTATPPSTPTATATRRLIRPTATPSDLRLDDVIVSWRQDPADFDQAIALVRLFVSGGRGPYKYYRDDLLQPGPMFEYVWRTCEPNPVSFRVESADGQSSPVVKLFERPNLVVPNPACPNP